MVPRAPRVVIAGAGLGGLRTAEGLRAAGYAGEVVVVGDEPHAPYNRPPLSKTALSTESSHEDLAFRRRQAVEDVVWRLGDAVTDVDLAARTAALAGGDVLEFDGLVLATGVTARRLDVPGPPPQRSAGRHVVRTLEDARALRSRLRPGTRLVVIGAGFIGCEVAATATALGCAVTCVAVDPEPMFRPLGERLGAALRRRHEAHGVRFHLAVGVAALLGADTVQGVVLTDGTELPADLVVEAIGSRCNTAPVEDCGLDLRDGVLVDGALRPLPAGAGAPVDGLAVAGDLARFPNPRFGAGAWRVEHWSVPTDLGRRAGAVLAAYVAGQPDYDEVAAATWPVLPSFWSDQYDLRLQSVGMPSLADPDAIRVLDGDIDAECIVGYFRGDDLMGVAGLNRTRELIAYRSLLGIGLYPNASSQATIA